MKLNIGISGISGRIGQRLVSIIQADDESLVNCGLVSENSHYKNDTIKVSDVCLKSDIWIDFSTPDAFEIVLQHCIETSTPLVTGTTGFSKKHFKEIENAAQHIPILWASNFAISVNLIQHLLSTYTQLRPSEASIIETHHTHKLDKPSGTAITLARSIKPHGILKTVKKDEFILDDVKIKSIRDAEIAGIHEIRLENSSESITITHSAKSSVIFARGAVNVAKWLNGKEKGNYTMNDYIESLS
jgi:4-hydroxy-tetrahydrodipicolinate reductase